jgi:hypothetical protein
MRRKTEIIIDDLEESVYLLELDGFERISSYIREAIHRIREIEVLERELESAKLEIQRYRDIISSNEINSK